jgi:drug/metabolite transporter (DMT)-like permease
MTTRVWLAFLALGLIWGMPYFFIKLAVSEMSPVWVAWGRLLCASLLLLPVALWRGQLRGILQHWRVILLFAFVELVGPFYLIALGEQWVTSSLAGILLAGVPLVVVIVAPFMGVHEQVGSRRLFGLIVGLVGVVALLGLDIGADSRGWLGAGAILLAAVGYAVGPLIVQKHLAGVDSLAVVSASVAVGFVVLTIPAILTVPAVMPSAVALGSVAILGIACTALGLLLFVYVITRAGASRAAVVTYVNPAVALLLGVFLLDEPFGAGPAVGLVLILLGSWLATGGDSKSAH